MLWHGWLGSLENWSTIWDTWPKQISSIRKGLPIAIQNKKDTPKAEVIKRMPNTGDPKTKYVNTETIKIENPKTAETKENYQKNQIILQGREQYFLPRSLVIDNDSKSIEPHQWTLKDGDKTATIIQWDRSVKRMGFIAKLPDQKNVDTKSGIRDNNSQEQRLILQLAGTTRNCKHSKTTRGK